MKPVMRWRNWETARPETVKVGDDHTEAEAAIERVEERLHKLMSSRKPTRTPDSFHKELGKLVWNECGMSRNADGLRAALDRIPSLREEFWETVSIPGSGEELNQTLEKAGRVADFLELAELMCIDALHREESAGGHFREEHRTEEGEARRNDEEFSYVAAWEYTGDLSKPTLHKEQLEFDYVKPTQRSYK